MIKSIKFNNKADLPLIRPNFIKGCNSLLIGEFLTKDLDMCDYFDFDKYNVKIYNLSTLEEINNIFLEEIPIFNLEYAPKYNLIFNHSFHDIFIININNGEQRIIGNNQELDLRKICLSLNDEIFFNISEKEVIQKYNFISNKTIDFSYYKENEKYNRLYDFDISQDSKYLYILSGISQTLSIWNVKEKKIIFSKEYDNSGTSKCSFSSDGKYITILSVFDWADSSYIDIFEFESNKHFEIKDINQGLFKISDILDICFFPNTYYICIFFNDNNNNKNILFWDFITNDKFIVYNIGDKNNNIDFMFSYDGKYLINYPTTYVSNKSYTKIWEVLVEE